MKRTIHKEDLAKADPLYEMFDKYIGQHVKAGGRMNYVEGEIVDIEVDDEDDIIYYVVKNKDGYLSEWDFSELKFPKIKVVYE